MMNYRVIESLKLYKIVKGIYIIAGTPFLYLKEKKVLLFGDLHLGQESSLFQNLSGNISADTKSFVQQIQKILSLYEIKELIINGDIKHNTSIITPQEISEFKYLIEHLQDQSLKIRLTIGNHDKLLQPFIQYLDLYPIEMTDDIKINNILISHGHRENFSKNFDVLVVSHEHPAFIFSGFNYARVKLQAFVTLSALEKDVIILPSANKISLGVNFPIKSSDQFLSPFLRKYANLETMTIFPFDNEVGLFELPPLAIWKS